MLLDGTLQVRKAERAETLELIEEGVTRGLKLGLGVMKGALDSISGSIIAILYTIESRGWYL